MPHSEQSTPSPEPLPYWLVNLPENEWTDSCPDYLRDISARNQHLLSVANDKLSRYGWKRVKDIVCEWQGIYFDSTMG